MTEEEAAAMFGRSQVKPPAADVSPSEWHLKEVDRVRGEMELLREQMEKLRTFVEDAHKLKRGTLLAK